MIVMALAFEIQNRVDDVFQSARAGNRSVFGNMTDEKNRDAARLRQHQELRGDFANLRNRSRRRFYLGRKSRLNRIDNQGRWLDSLNFAKDIFEISFRKQEQIWRGNSQTLAP